MLVKQSLDVSFIKGIDTKSDPKRTPIGGFKSLENTIFTKGGLLQKRNGYQQFSSLPNDATYITTLNDNATAIGTSIAARNASNDSWVSKGSIDPLSIDTLPLIRNNLNQTACDAAVSNGLVCLAYLESDGSTTTNKYVIADAVTGQNIVSPIAIPVASGSVSGGMRVFVLGRYFIIVFTNTITATAHLQYIAISIASPTTVSANTDIASAYISATTLSWDGYVANNYLYIAYNTTSGGQAIKVTSLSSSLNLTTAKTFLGYKATIISLTADTTNPTAPIVYVTIYRSDTNASFFFVLDQNLNTILIPIVIPIVPVVMLNITSAAVNGTCKIFWEETVNYSWASIPTHFIRSVSVTPVIITSYSVFAAFAASITVSNNAGLTNGMYIVDLTTPANIGGAVTFTIVGSVLTLSDTTNGASASSPGDQLGFATVSSVTTIVRSVGLASKAFVVDDVIYFLASYQSTYQPTYFLINGSTSLSSAPIVVAKLAYENGGGYLTTGLPGVTVSDTTAYISYRFKDLIQAVNKNTNVASGTQTAGIYSQTGINLSTFTIGTQNLYSVEIAKDLHMTGGFLWMYDGYLPVEHNFFLWPDTFSAVWSATGGNIVAKPDGATNTNAYYYQVTYEWTDNQGNAYRSAPAIPVSVTTTGSGSAGSVALKIPSLRLTYKVSNAVKIVIYRWSVAQQSYYQVTSITVPTLNSTTVDEISYTDTLADATILGNNLIYTTGGVVEDVNAPGSNVLALYDTRLWLVDAEDKNLLWFSKQVIEATPVEMSDLFTMFVPPTTGAEGTTGPISALFPLDDKLIIFKNNAIYYINGSGPDNTGANNQYSPPIFVTSTVGCANQKSIVFMPQGLMFQSNKGIWLLDRSLATSYIGAPVEDYNEAIVLSADIIPETNQVRFALDTGITLAYDYYYGEWGTFTGVPAISSCIYQGLHTFIDSYSRVYQESPGVYLDGSRPVLISFTTGPLRLGDLQNYQRAYFFYLLGQYFSPHKLQVSISYDYSDSPSQSVLLTPINYAGTYGTGALNSPYGQGTPYGGPGNLEQFRVFLERQRCQAFAITVQEVYDSTYEVPAGQGLSLSGINIVMGFKGKFPTLPSNISFG